jgi:YfiH family protein
VITPVWPVPANVRAVCSTRESGFSAGPYAGLNLGDHVGDNAEAVSRNRQHFAQTLAAHPVFLKQVHGWDVAELEANTPDGQIADACATVVSGVACTVMVADCLPVLFCSADGTMVAAAHAGWRGLLGQGGYGVLEATVERFKPFVKVIYTQNAIDHVANDAADEVSENTLLAWLGPCIGPQAFEVGAEVRGAFVQDDAACDALFKPLGDGKFLADLAGLARLRLKRLGVTLLYGNDSSTAWCTVSNPSQFFSHRRDLGISGRFAASVWRV